MSCNWSAQRTLLDRVNAQFSIILTSLLAVSFLFALPSAERAVAQNKRKSLLVAEVDSIFPNVRSGGPVAMNWMLDWAGAGLLEGRLHFVLRESGVKYGEFYSHEMVLVTGQQRFSMLLPPINDVYVFTTLDVHAEFITKDKIYDLEILARRVPGTENRSFSVCACTPLSVNPGAWFTQVVRELQFVEISPVQVRKELSSLPMYVVPDEMPNDPITYCGFDLVILDGDGFADMGKRKLEVLLKWVDAGGSLCVIPKGLLSPYHAETLNQLSGAAKDDPKFLLDSTGKLMGEDDWATDPQVQRYRKGLGRVAIVLGRPKEDYDWKETTAFLWKLTKDQTKNSIAAGVWKEPARPRSDQDNIVADTYQVRPLQSISGVISHLMPEGVRVVPLSLIALMLIIYVAVIGPGDYMLLGMLRQRKLTWVFFPLVTVAFTVFTVWLSHAYMATSGTRKAAVIMDVVEGGTIVRRNRIELMFPASHQTYKSDVQKKLFTALNHRRFGETLYEYVPNYDIRRTVETGLYTGKVPTQYSVVQNVPQWTPQMNRILTIAPEDESTAFPWDYYEKYDVKSQKVIRQELVSQIHKAFGTSASAYIVLANRKLDVVTGIPYLSAPSTSDGLWQSTSAYGYSDRVSTFLMDICVRHSDGFFSVVSQVAPTGGNNFEDLTLLDPTDDKQWLLVIAIPKDDDLIVYRRLYHGGN